MDLLCFKDRKQRDEWKNALFAELWSAENICPETHTDLSFVCFDGKIRAHRTLVKKFCPTVSRIFDTFQNLSDSGEISIIVPDVKLQTARNFLQLLYTGSISLRLQSEIDELDFFGFRQLGFFIQYNWVDVPGFVQCEYANISITKALDLNQSSGSIRSLSLRISSSSDTGSVTSGPADHSRSESNIPHEARPVPAARKTQSCSLEIARTERSNSETDQTGLQINNSSNTSGSPAPAFSTSSSGLTIHKTGSTSQSSKTEIKNDGLSIQRNGFISQNLFGERIQNPLCFDIDDDVSDQSSIDIKEEPVDLEATSQPETPPNVDSNKLIQISIKEKQMITLTTENPIFIEIDSDSDISSSGIKIEVDVLESQPLLQSTPKADQISDKEDNMTPKADQISDKEDNTSMDIVPFSTTQDTTSLIPKTELEPTTNINTFTDINMPTTVEVVTLPKRKSRRPSRFGDNGLDQIERKNSRKSTGISEGKGSNCAQFTCTVCNLNFSEEIILNRHTKLVHSSSPGHQCKECQMIFFTQNILKEHLQRVHLKDNTNKGSQDHKEIVIHQCKFCSKKFVDEQDMMSHVSSKHKTRRCPTCGAKFWSKEKLNKHVEVNHALTSTNDVQIERNCKKQKRSPSVEKSKNEDQPKRLKNCSAQTGLVDGSKTANLKDTSVKSSDNVVESGTLVESTASKVELSGSYSCNLCDQTFTQICNMKRHVDTVHKKIKNFQCPQCHKKFSRGPYLQEHVNVVHIKIRHLKCQLCPATFGRMGNLKSHMRSHQYGKKTRNSLLKN